MANVIVIFVLGSNNPDVEINEPKIECESIPLHELLIIYKGKISKVTIQWRNLADTTLTPRDQSPHHQYLRHMDIMYPYTMH